MLHVTKLKKGRNGVGPLLFSVLGLGDNHVCMDSSTCTRLLTPGCGVFLDGVGGDSFINPVSPNIHIQILQTDLHTFP